MLIYSLGVVMCCSKSGLPSLNDGTTYKCRECFRSVCPKETGGLTVYSITKHDHLVDIRAFGVRQNKCC
jgi:hypothetical protein